MSEQPGGERVDVYCDLHRKLSSVKALAGPHKGRVIDKPHDIVLEDVVLRVNQGGLHRVRATGVRSVHAFARGRRSQATPSSIRAMPAVIRVRYNPHLRGDFFDAASGQALTSLAFLAIEGKTAWGIL